MSGGLSTVALLGFCILCEAAFQILFKMAADRAEAHAASLPLGVARQPLLWLGVLLWAIEVAAWLLVLQRLPLVVAFPIMTVNYALIPLAGRLLLKEPLDRRLVAGGALIGLGVLCIGLGGG